MNDQSKDLPLGSETLSALLELFNIKSKSKLKKYCRDLVITRSDLVEIILAARVDQLAGYKYASHFADIVPNHLSPQTQELEALARSGIGKLEGESAKAMTRLSQMFNERKLFTAHLFYTPDKRYWYLFYFSTGRGRDTDKLKNHWKHGPHIHLITDLWSQISMLDAWTQVKGGRVNFPGALHIRFNEERQKAL